MFGDVVLTLVQQHNLNIQVVFDRLNSWTQDLCFHNPTLFKTLQWKVSPTNPNELHCIGKGRFLDAEILCDEQKVKINLKMAMLARPFYWKIDAFLKSEMKALLQPTEIR